MPLIGKNKQYKGSVEYIFIILVKINDEFLFFIQSKQDAIVDLVATKSASIFYLID